MYTHAYIDSTTPYQHPLDVINHEVFTLHNTTILDYHVQHVNPVLQDIVQTPYTEDDISIIINSIADNYTTYFGLSDNQLYAYWFYKASAVDKQQYYQIPKDFLVLVENKKPKALLCVMEIPVKNLNKMNYRED